MNIFVWLVAIYVFFYTVGYARIVYKDGNKVGAIFIAILAIPLVILPYFVNNH